MKISNEELKEIVAGCIEGVHPTSYEIAMAAELLAVREAQSVPAAYRYRYNGKHLASVGCGDMVSSWKYCEEAGLTNPDERYEHQELFTAPPAPAVPDMVGLSVSVDVSTSDDNAGYRYFGRITEVQQSVSPKDKGGVVLLVQDDVEANFNEVIVPDGFKLVPVEPTEEMCDAVLGFACFSRDGDGARLIYREMLAAAPTPTK